MITWIKRHWGALDVLVNNAGMNIRKHTLEFTPEEYKMISDVDLMAPFELSCSLPPLLVKGQHPVIINVASVAGFLDVQDRFALCHV